MPHLKYVLYTFLNTCVHTCMLSTNTCDAACTTVTFRYTVSVVPVKGVLTADMLLISLYRLATLYQVYTLPHLCHEQPLNIFTLAIPALPSCRVLTLQSRSSTQSRTGTYRPYWQSRPQYRYMAVSCSPPRKLTHTVSRGQTSGVKGLAP